MTFPAWLDPTPATREFVAGFADLPVREPFRSCRIEIRLAEIQGVAEERERSDDKQREWARKSAEIRRARAAADAMARGETMLERKRRMHREAQKRRYAVLRSLDEGRMEIPKL